MAGTEVTAPSMQAGETESQVNTPAPAQKEVNTPPMTVFRANEVVVARCECCKMIDEYTRAYIAQVRSKHLGRMLCGLCITAVKDEIVKSNHRLNLEGALNRHFKFYEECRSLPPMSLNEFIDFMKHSLFKNAVRSNPTTPTGGSSGSGKNFTRSSSCFPSMDA